MQRTALFLAVIAFAGLALSSSTVKAAGPTLLSPADLDASIQVLPLKGQNSDALSLFKARILELSDRPERIRELAALQQASQLISIARRIRIHRAEALPRIAGL